MAAVRPGVRLRRRPRPDEGPDDEGPDDELVLTGGGEVFRVPLAPSALARQAVLVVALPALQPLVPVPVPRPRRVGVLPDGATPFTAERRLPGVRPQRLDPIGASQLAGVLHALADVGPRRAREWGVPGDGPVLLHGALGLAALLTDPATGLLTGVVDWRPRLGDPAEAVGADAAALLPVDEQPEG